VWALEVLDATGQAVLHAYSAANVANELYNSTINPRDMLDTGVTFAVPTIGNGKVYVGQVDQLSVFGQLP
jgi:hypothetical protein